MVSDTELDALQAQLRGKTSGQQVGITSTVLFEKCDAAIRALRAERDMAIAGTPSTTSTGSPGYTAVYQAWQRSQADLTAAREAMKDIDKAQAMRAHAIRKEQARADRAEIKNEELRQLLRLCRIHITDDADYNYGDLPTKIDAVLNRK